MTEEEQNTSKVTSDRLKENAGNELKEQKKEEK